MHAHKIVMWRPSQIPIDRITSFARTSVPYEVLNRKRKGVEKLKTVQPFSGQE